MRNTAESIREHGVLVPAIARPREDGGYEIVPGHRRKRACEPAGMETMPVIVRELDDDAATLVMVDSNIQRESLLPSERAFAYKMKLDALNRRMGRPSKENVRQFVSTFSIKRSTEIVGEQAGSSRNQVQRFIRLTELIPELLDMLDKLVELMVETLSSRRETISVSGEERPTWLVQERLRKLNAHHIEYVLNCLQSNRTKIHNIKRAVPAPTSDAVLYRPNFAHVAESWSFSTAAGDAV